MQAQLLQKILPQDLMTRLSTLSVETWGLTLLPPLQATAQAAVTPQSAALEGSRTLPMPEV